MRVHLTASTYSTHAEFHMYKKHFAPMRNFSISWADNFTPDGGEGGGGGRCYVMTLRWYMAGRWARMSSLPEKSRERQSCPFAPVTLQDWRLSSRDVRWSFPAVVTYKKGRRRAAGRTPPSFTKNSSSLQSSVQSVVWNGKKKKEDGDVKDLLGGGELCAGHRWMRWR